MRECQQSKPKVHMMEGILKPGCIARSAGDRPLDRVVNGTSDERYLIYVAHPDRDFSERPDAGVGFPAKPFPPEQA
jgi:hypothetical protein